MQYFFFKIQAFVESLFIEKRQRGDNPILIRYNTIFSWRVFIAAKSEVLRQ